LGIIAPHRRQVNPFLFGLTGLLVLVAAGWVFLLILKSVYGRYELSDLVPTKERLQTTLAAGESEIGILNSRFSEQLFPPESTWLRNNVTTWERFGAEMDLRCDVIDDQAVESGTLGKYRLVVLPGSKALSDKQILEIKKYMDNGGSVFATSSTGSYTESGDWRGWGFLSEVFGLQFTAEITPDEATKLHTLRGGLPITAGIPTGFSLKVATWDRPMACEVVEPRTTQASTWYNFKRDSGLVREAIEMSAGIAYGTYGRGRFVWMGFELNSVLGEQEDYVYFDILCRRSVDWLTYTPAARVRDWPASYRAAAIVVASLSTEFENVKNLFEPIRSGKIPITLFVDPEAALAHRALASTLSSFGEVGVLLSPQPAAVSPEEGPQLINASTQVRTKIGDLTRSDIAGGLPATGMYNDHDIHSLLEAGYEYVVADSMTDRAVPKTMIRGNLPLVAFTKTARGDDEVVGEFGLTDTSYQLYTYQEDVDRVLFHGGIYVLKIHSNLQCRPEYAPVLTNLVQYLRSKNFWVSTAGDLTRWWLTKSALEISVRARSKRRIGLVVSNPSGSAIQNAVVQVYVNKPVSHVIITSDIMGTQIPPYRLNERTQVVEITLPSLDGGGSLSLDIDYDIVSS
jgi:hypothetical protein